MPKAVFPITRRKLFSTCGTLVGHFSVAGGLRVACSFVKRHSDEEKWDHPIGPVAEDMVRQLLAMVKEWDPVRGSWSVDAATTECTLWCDASSIALGVALEVSGHIVEDGRGCVKRMTEPTSTLLN